MEMKKAASVLAHGKRRTKTSKYIISAVQIIFNTFACACIGWSFAFLVFSQIALTVLLFAVGAAAAWGAEALSNGKD